MAINRRQHNRASDTEKGRALAAWLNRVPDAPAAMLIGFCANTEDARRYQRKVSKIADNFWEITVNARTSVRIQDDRIDLQLLPQDNDSTAIFRFWELLRSGNASRLRKCPNCKDYWYCAGLADRGFCSDACKRSFWQKTPHGRKVKKEYMRRLRAIHHEQGKISAATASRRRDSRSILRTLGK